MPEKLRPIENIAIARLKPAQIKMTAEIEIGAEQMGGQCCICQCICNWPGCICICDCICDYMGDGLKLPFTVAYDVVYERVAEATVEFGEQTIKQARMVIGMEPTVYEQLKEKERLVEVGTLKTGAKQYLVKRTSNRRGQ